MPPTLTDDDRARARERAVAARRVRADLKGQLRSEQLGFTGIVELAREDTDLGQAASRLRVSDVLLALPGVGQARADAILVRAGVSGQRRLRALGSQQVVRLAQELRS